MAMADVTKTLARFAHEATPDEDVTNVFHLSLLDWAAVGIAGTDEPVAHLLREQALEEAGAPQATMIGHQTRVPARMAALVNGTTSHALDYDDTHFAHIGHPSVAVIPAALAAAELSGADGRVMQEAALIGAEASIRVGVWLGRDHYQTGFHQTATAGAFGAAIAAARILRLNPDQIEMVLGLVATRASGLKSQFGTMGKPFNAGLAASNGVEAALLISRGFISNSMALEVDQGFSPTHHGQRVAAALDGLGTDWMFNSIQHKFHACCHGLHATLEALSDISSVPESFTEIHVFTHPRWMSVCNNPEPVTGLEAKFSYRMTVAMCLLGHNTGRLDSFRDDLCLEPAVVALRNKVRISADPGLSEMQARVDLTAVDGGAQSVFHDLDVVADIAARRQKVHAKAQSLIGRNRAARLWQAIESASDLTKLTTLLT